MKAIWIGAGALSLGLVLIAWLQRVKRRQTEGKSPMSRSWMVEHAYDRNGDHRWK